MKDLCNHVNHHIYLEIPEIYDGWFMIYCQKCKKAQLRDRFKVIKKVVNMFILHCEREGLSYDS